MVQKWIFFFLVGICWGMSFILMDIILTTMAFTDMVLMRLIISAPPLILWAAFTGHGHYFRKWKNWGMWLVLAIFGVLAPFFLIGWGITHIGPAVAAIANSMVPMWTLLIVTFLKMEKLTRKKLAGIFMAVCGVTLVVSPSLGQESGEQKLFLFGVMAVLAAGSLYATNLILTRKILDRRNISSVGQACGQSTAAALLSIVLLLLADAPASQAIHSMIKDTRVLTAMLCLALVSTALAYLLFTWMVANAGALFASMSIVQTPVVAAFFSSVFLNQPLQRVQIVGMIMVMAGVAVIELNQTHRRRRPPIP